MSGFQPLPEGNMTNVRKNKEHGVLQTCSATSQMCNPIEVAFPLGVSQLELQLSSQIDNLEF